MSIKYISTKHSLINISGLVFTFNVLSSDNKKKAILPFLYENSITARQKFAEMVSLYMFLKS